MEKDWQKRPSDSYLQEAQKKDSNRAITPVWRQSLSLHTCHQGPCNPSSWATFMLNPHWGRAAVGKKSHVSMYAGLLQLCPTLCNPVDCSLPCFSVRGFSRQEYWSVLANTGCHTLLEHHMSDYPSCQPPWVPGAARTPVSQAAAPPPHLALTGTNTSLPGQPQEQTPVDDPHAEVEIKPHLKPRGSVAKEEDPKPSH